MRRWLCSAALLAGMAITVACSFDTKRIEQKTNEIASIEPVQKEFMQATWKPEYIPEVKAAPNETPTVTEMPVEEVQKPFTEYDRHLLAKLAMAEAEGESLEGKALVVKVVLNRVEDKYFPDSVEEVIFQQTESGTYQFSPMAEGGRWYTTEPTEECYQAVDMVGNGWDESQGALYFESCPDPTWHSRNLEFLFKVGNHKFYR